MPFAGLVKVSASKAGIFINPERQGQITAPAMDWVGSFCGLVNPLIDPLWAYPRQAL